MFLVLIGAPISQGEKKDLVLSSKFSTGGNTLLTTGNSRKNIKTSIEGSSKRIAAVYHDIGIWTDRTIDYLDPSIVQANNYLREIGKAEWIEEIEWMCRWES
ncbi:hypothetical protein [Pedobacter hiemivivus]|uniref:hypothetical protein n=1 Tax=Pedobacter hiemivivus TaxID=2530454 RepID=UPI00197FCFF9|nr:hypothetical protein [Pedobacter hiemivivus]